MPITDIFSQDELGACFYDIPPKSKPIKEDIKRKLRPSAASRSRLSRKTADAESASDDSCIERDIENMHLGKYLLHAMVTTRCSRSVAIVREVSWLFAEFRECYKRMQAWLATSEW